jgi:hypothetical protein
MLLRGVTCESNLVPARGYCRHAALWLARRCKRGDWFRRGNSARDMYELLRERRFKLQSAYSNWLHDILNNAWNDKLWNGYQLSFMFHHIPGSFDRKCDVMEDEIDRVYRTLVPQVERSPRSPAGSQRLPILVAFPDYPIRKLDRSSTLDVKINDGLHYHGTVLVHTESRLKIGVDIHMKEHADRYIRHGGALRRIHIQPIYEPSAKTAVGYGFKALEWRIPDTDRIFIRPRAVSELPVGPRDQERKDVKAHERAGCKQGKRIITAPRTGSIYRF